MDKNEHKAALLPSINRLKRTLLALVGDANAATDLTDCVNVDLCRIEDGLNRAFRDLREIPEEHLDGLRQIARREQDGSTA